MNTSKLPSKNEIFEEYNNLKSIDEKIEYVKSLQYLDIYNTIKINYDNVIKRLSAEKQSQELKTDTNISCTDYVKELQLFHNDEFVIADSYTVVEPALSNFNKDQSITHAELNNYMNDSKDFKLESIIVLPELTQ